MARNGFYPSGYGIAIKKRAFFKPALDRWVIRMSQFGLHKRWMEEDLLLDKEQRFKALAASEEVSTIQYTSDICLPL